MINLHGRFYIEEDACGEWDVVDRIDGTLLGHANRNRALECKRFAIAYVKLHGDIDLCSFPYSLEQPLHYDDWVGRNRKHVQDQFVLGIVASQNNGRS
jgi:hypothetical protein